MDSKLALKAGDLSSGLSVYMYIYTYVLLHLNAFVWQTYHFDNW